MACCGDDDNHEQEGIVQERKCRDVLFTLLFIGYWVGMFVVAGIAFREGDPNRLIFPLDSQGMLCGTTNTYRNETIDLTSRPNLHYLNALDLLNPINMLYAKSVCVPGCPSTDNVCDLTSIPCTNTSQYRCPYYRMADGKLYGKLTGVAANDTDYWSALGSASLDSCNSTFLQAVAGKIDVSKFGISASMCSAAGPVSGKYLQATSQLPGKGPCYPVWTATVPYFNRCFPNFSDNFTSSVYSVLDATSGVLGSAVATARNAFSSTGSAFSTYVADISKGIAIILVGGLTCGVVLSLVWMFVLRYFSGFMAWMTIIGVNVGLAGCTVYAYANAGMLTAAGALGANIASQLPPLMDPTLVSRQYWAYIAYGLTAFTALIFIITLVMLRRVAIAIACIKVASQAVSTMPSIMFFPMLPFVLEVGLIIYWVAITAVLYSAGTPTPHWRSTSQYAPLGLKELMLAGNVTSAPPPPKTPNITGLSTDDVIDLCAASPDCYITYDWNNELMYSFIFHLFGLLWTNQFIVGFASVVVAGAVAQFYWAHGDRSSMPTYPVLKSMRTTVIFNLGSVAFGALVIAIIQFIRLMLEYLDKKTRQLQQQSKIAEWAMCCVRCCMWCLEKVVAFINRNAFILVAVKGSNYCVSAARAVQLIVSNAIRLATVNVVGGALIFLGKVAVASGCGLVALGMSRWQYYTDAQTYPATYLSSAILPIAVAVITGFIVAQIFFSVYEMAIDTILLSFCEDAETNSGHPRFAPPLLLEAIGEKSPDQAADPYSHGGAKHKHRH